MSYNPSLSASGGEHPDSTTLLVTSIVGLLCCAPVNIWVLLKSNGILSAPGGFDTSKVNSARIIAIVSLVLWAILVVVNFGTLAALLSIGNS